MAYTQADVDMADAHILQGERHIIQQEELISRLRSQGLPTQAAEELLILFNSALQHHREHRDSMFNSLRLHPSG